MKRISYFIVLLFLIFVAGCGGKKETVITGHVTGTPDTKILEYTPPFSGTGYAGFRDTLYLDGEGNFELIFSIDKPVFITFMHRNPYLPVKLLVEPGNSYNIDMDISRKDTRITGANEKGQMLYATLPDPPYIGMEVEKFNLKQDSSLVSIHSKVEEMKQSDLSKFKELLDNREISKSFFNLIKTDRDCYYASMEANVSLNKTYRVVETKQFVLPGGENLLENLTKIYTQYSPDDKRLTVSTFWPEYAQHYIADYKQFIREDLDVGKIRELYSKNMAYTFLIGESKKYLTGKPLEFFQATLIHYTSIRKRYEKELITLFEQFTKDYPDNEYSKYIKPEIDQIVKYHQDIEKPFDETVHFMDNYENIATLEEAIKPFRGRKVYIDIWATWCNSCKEEFEHQQALKKILKEQDIQPLYISIDEDNRNTKWKEAIKFYGLSGAHIRAGKELSAYLFKRYDNSNPHISIPWYILFDENGKVIREHAESPSEIVVNGLSFQ